MSNVFTLDNLREEVEREFSPIKLALKDGSEIVLRSLIRLNKKSRDAVLDTLKELEGLEDSEESSDEEVEKLVGAAGKIIELIAGSDGKRLVKELDGDLALMMKILQKWLEASQPGEAPSSPA